MPLPAQCCRSEQAIVKMAPASDLSLRGGRRPTWRPEREARGSALGVQSREGSHDFADSLPVIRLGTARLPRRFAPRNDTSGEREVHQRPPTVELLPTGRSLSAATGPVGAITILTAACANRLCSAGRGQPGPATHLQSVQTAVKMANAPELSLRGGQRPTWRPERAARGSALGVQSRSTLLDNRAAPANSQAAAIPLERASFFYKKQPLHCAAAAVLFCFTSCRRYGRPHHRGRARYKHARSDGHRQQRHRGRHRDAPPSRPSRPRAQR